MNPAMEKEDALLKIYRRRLHMADNKFEKGKPARMKYRARYRNEFEPDSSQQTEEGHRVSVVSGTGIIDTMFASMTAVDVEFLTRNIGNGTQLQSRAATAALNQAWRDAKGQRRAKDAIKDALTVDIGWAKVYYDYREEIMLQDVPDEALKAQIATLSDKYKVDPEDVPKDELELTEQATVVTRDRICFDYVPWDMIRPDPSAKRIEDVRWICQYTMLPAYEVRNNPTWADFVTDRYGVTRGRDMLDTLAGDTTMDQYTNEVLFADLSSDEFEDDQMVTVCEMWDLETGLITTFPKVRGDLVLYQRENPLMVNVDYEDRNPFKPLIVRKDNDDLAGIGDMRVIYPALKELDEYRSNLATHIERTIPKIMGPEEGMTQKGKDALKSPVWGEFIGTTGTDGNAFTALQPPPLPQEFFGMPDRIQVEMKDGTGVSEPMRGVFPSKRTTATETQIVTNRGDMRQSERRSALEEWYLSIARTMLQLMQTYYDQDRMLRYTDDLGQDFVWAWNAEDISMEADLDIAITPWENLTRDERVQRFLLLMNLALPIPEADRGAFVRQAALEMGYREEDIRALVKSDEEVKVEQQAAQANALAVSPQPGGGAPGLQIG